MIPNYLRSAAVLRRGTQEFQALQRRIDRSGAGSPLLVVPIQRTLAASPTVSSPIQSSMAHTGMNSFGFPLKKCFDEICADDASPQPFEEPPAIRSYCISPLSDTATIEEAFGPDVVAVLNGTSDKETASQDGGVSHVCSTPPDDSPRLVPARLSEPTCDTVPNQYTSELSVPSEVLSVARSVEELGEGDLDGFIQVLSKKQASAYSKSVAKNNVSRQDKSMKRHREAAVRPQAHPTRILQAPRQRPAGADCKAPPPLAAATREAEAAVPTASAVATTRLNAAAAAWYPTPQEQAPDELFQVEQLSIPLFPPELLLQAALAYGPMQAMLNPGAGGLPAFPYHLLPMMLQPQVMGPMASMATDDTNMEPENNNASLPRPPSVGPPMHARPTSTTRKSAPFARGVQSIKILARPTQ